MLFQFLLEDSRNIRCTFSINIPVVIPVSLPTRLPLPLPQLLKKENQKSKMIRKRLQKIQDFRRRNIYVTLLFAPVIGCLSCLVCYLVGIKLVLSKMIGVTVFMVLWWLEGTVKMGLTGLLPIILLPLLGIANGTRVSQIYFSDSVIVCLGSLIMASAVETYQLHNRVATFILKYAYRRGLTGILASFVFLTGFISMWLSNTATAALMVPLSRATMDQMQQKMNHQYSPTRFQYAGIAIDLSIAFAASLGGMATLTGTGSNLVLQGVMLSLFGRAGEVTFIDWFLLAAPIAIINLFLLWFLLTIVFLWYPIAEEERRTSERTSEESIIAATTTPLSSQRIPDAGIEARSDSTTDLEMISNPLSESQRSSNLITASLDNETTTVKSFASPGQRRQDATPGTSPLSLEVEEELRSLGYPERVVIFVFILMGILWLTRDPPGDWGWSNLLDIEDYATDGTVAIAACVTLMILPNLPPSSAGYCYSSCSSTSTIIMTSNTSSSNQSKKAFEKLRTTEEEEEEEERGGGARQYSIDHPQDDHNHNNNNNNKDDDDLDPTEPLSHQQDPTKRYRDLSYQPILPWTVISKLNWDILFLLGGGFALSYGFQTSGLTERLAIVITSSGPRDLSSLIILSTLVACLSTNFMSNVAAANVLLPSLACVGPRFGEDPLVVLLPVALSISLAFLFPMGTPPNAIVLSNQRVTIRLLFQMGSLCSLVSLSSILLYSLFVVPWLFPSLQRVSEGIRSTCDG